MFKKIVATVGTIALGLIAVVACPASAHDHSVAASGSVVSVNIANYQTTDGSAMPNRVTVPLGGRRPAPVC